MSPRGDPAAGAAGDRRDRPAAALLPLAPIGVAPGIRLAQRLDPTWFYRIADTGMGLTGLKLVRDGFA